MYGQLIEQAEKYLRSLYQQDDIAAELKRKLADLLARGEIATKVDLRLDLEKAVSGDTITIDVPTQVTCETCNGSGAKKGTDPIKCTTCGGAGQVRMQQGFFSIQQTCPNCRGTGTIISDPCPDCHGQGRVKEQKTLSVKVPSGVDTGDRIRLAGEGEAGENGGPSRVGTSNSPPSAAVTKLMGTSQ